MGIFDFIRRKFEQLKPDWLQAALPAQFTLHMKAPAPLMPEKSSHRGSFTIPTADEVVVEKRAASFTPDLFCFGASIFVNDVLMQLAKAVDGNYQGADYFSLP